MLKRFSRSDVRFVINLIFAVYNVVLGIASYSWWFITAGAYYIILSVMRLLVIRCTAKEKENEVFVMRFSGLMLFLLSVVLCGTVYMTIRFDMGTKYHEIAMITIALYAFTKLTLAIIGFVKSKRDLSPLIRTVRSISVADAVVSIYSLQRSMLVSFEGMTPENITLFNTLSGIGMCIIVVIIGLNLMLGKDLRRNEIETCKDE